MSDTVFEYLVESGTQELAQHLIKKEHLSEKEALARVYASDFYARLSNRKSGLFGESQASLIHLFTLSQQRQSCGTTFRIS